MIPEIVARRKFLGVDEMEREALALERRRGGQQGGRYIYRHDCSERQDEQFELLDSFIRAV
jgi:hypothetical protein